jgi:hypothetical protein
MTRRTRLPSQFDVARFRHLRRRVKPDQSLPARMEAISRALVARPYVDFPLVGSPDQPEVFTASLRGFDCVTFVETVLASSLASTPEQFADLLRRIRYAGGRIDWRRRNHYTSDWIRKNTRAGFVRPVSVGGPALTRTRILNVLPGYPALRMRLRFVPKRRFWAGRDAVRTGDLLMFVSTRPHLDIFHLGIAVRDGERLLLRNAARSRRHVVDQPLADFLAENRMAGVVVVRPVEPGRGRQRAR